MDGCTVCENDGIRYSSEENNNFTLSEDINGPLLAAVIGIEMVAGLITNSFVLILTVCSHSIKWKQPSIIFLTNMLIVNLAIVLFVMPFPIITAAYGKWIFGSTISQKEKVCIFAAYLFWYIVTMITECLVLLSFDRFFFIVKPLEYKRYMTAKKAVTIITISWILGAILNSPPLTKLLGRFEFAFSYGMCVPGWQGETAYVLYNSIIFIIFIGSIVITSLWTYCHTRKYLKNRNNRLSFVPQNTSVYSSQEKKLIGLFGTLILVHLFWYTPALTVAFTGLVIVLPPIPYTIAFVFFLSLTSISPLIQSFFRTDIRNAIFSCTNSKCSSSPIVAYSEEP